MPEPQIHASALAPLVDEVDEAGVNRAGVGEQADDSLENFVQIE